MCITNPTAPTTQHQYTSKLPLHDTISTALLHHQDVEDSSFSMSSTTSNTKPAGSMGASASSTKEQKQQHCFRRSEIVTSSEVLGKGAFAEVFQVNAFRHGKRDDSLRSNAATGRNIYVIKQLRESLALNKQDFEAAVTSLNTEAEFLSQLDHPNILRLRGMARQETDQRYCGKDHFLVLDKLDETLSQRLIRWRHGEIAGRTANGQNPKLNCAYQIALALEYLHNKRILYRDLKPDNIGFKGDTVQLFDMGLSRVLPDKHASPDDFFHMSAAGSRRYMAPEVVLKQPYNATCDAYGWAMVFYQILSLQRPYATYNRHQHYEHVCENAKRPKLARYWPETLKCLLEEAWEQIPRARLTTPEIVLRLRPLLNMPVEDTLSSPERSFMAVQDMACLLSLPTRIRSKTVEDDTTESTQESNLSRSA